jgi:hypothetical protein
MILVLILTYTGTFTHFIIKVKLQQSLYKPISDPEISRSFSLPGFEAVDI